MTFSSDNVLLFLAVLDHGSFSAAARSLRRVPSAVSMAIAHLEAELDLQLFDRSGREPQPTAAARALEPQARQLALQLRELQAHALALTQGLENRLTLAIAPELLSARWTAPLAQLAAEHPLLDVEVLVTPQADALAMLHTGRAQLALVFERPRLDGREGFREVGNETLVAVVAPGHALLQEVTRRAAWARPSWCARARSSSPAATPAWPTRAWSSAGMSGTPTAPRPPAACSRPAWAGAGCRAAWCRSNWPADGSAPCRCRA